MRVNKAIIIKLVLPKRNKRNQKLKQNQVATKESQLVVFDNIFTWMRANKGEWLWYDIYQQSQWLYRTWKGQWLQRITTGNPPANKHSSTSFNTKEKEQEKKKKKESGKFLQWQWQWELRNGNLLLFPFLFLMLLNWFWYYWQDDILFLRFFNFPFIIIIYI